MKIGVAVCGESSSTSTPKADNEYAVKTQLDLMDDPAAFDVLASSHELSVHALASEPVTALGKLRRLQLLFAHDPSYPCSQILRELDGLAGVPTRSLKMMIQVEHAQYEEVLLLDADPHDMSALEIEDASKALAMKGEAATSLGRQQLALQYFRAAIALARACGTHYRLRMILIDWHRAHTLTGHKPAADDLELLLLEPLSERGRQYGQRVRAQTLIASGAYEDAIRALGPIALDVPEDASMREFLHARIDVPRARREDDPLIHPSLPYNRLAAAIRAVKTGEAVHLNDIQGEPYTTYARILEAYSLSRVPKMARVVLGRLGDEPFGGPEVSAAWASLTLLAALTEELGVTALQAFKTLQESAGLLRYMTRVGREMRLLSPEVHMLLLISPVGPQMNGLADLSLLAGQVVIHGGNQIKLPGRTGREVVLEGAGHVQAEMITRMERKRLNEALVGVGGAKNVVNLGRVLRYTVLLYRAALGTGDSTVIGSWEAAYAQVYAMLSPDTQCLFEKTAADSVL